MSMKRKIIYNIYIIGLVLALMLLNHVCYSSLVEKKSEPVLWGSTYMTLNNPFFTVIDTEIRNVVKAQGDNLLTLDAQLSLEKQNEQIYYLCEQGAKVIIINPTDYEGVEEALRYASSKGVHIIAVDTSVYNGNDFVDYTIVSDNYKAGQLIAQDMMSQKESANILVLTHQSAYSAAERVNGFVDTIKDNPNYHIIDYVECQGQLENSMPGVEKVIEEGKEFDVVMALNDPSALGAIAALQQANLLDQVLVYGVDGTPEAKVLINDGFMEATVAQYPSLMGKEAARAANQLLQGEQPTSDLAFQVSLINRKNIQDFSLEDWQ